MINNFFQFVSVYISIGLIFLIVNCSQQPQDKYVYFNDTINHDIIGKIYRLRHIKKSLRVTGYYIGINTSPTYMFRIHKKDTLDLPKMPVSSIMNFGDSIYKVHNSNKIIIYKKNNEIITFYLEE